MLLLKNVDFRFTHTHIIAGRRDILQNLLPSPLLFLPVGSHSLYAVLIILGAFLAKTIP